MDSIPEFTYDDFLKSDKPYKYAYGFASNGFELTAVIELLSKQAKKLKIGNFKTLYAKYAAEIRKTSNEIAQTHHTDFDGQVMELDTGTWRADETGVYGRSPFSDGELLICPHPLMPTMRLVNIDSNDEKIQLSYKKGGIWRKTIVPKSLIASANKIISLSDIGIAVTSENARGIVRYLSDIESLNYDRMPERNCIGRCGWVEGEEIRFAPYIDDIEFDGEGNFKKLWNSIRNKGDFDQWRIVADEARGNIQARIVLAASFASALVQPLGCLPFFVHLWSSISGTGKTVALMLAASVWADPAKGSYWTTFDSTGVGQELTAGFLNSMPLILDELQLVKEKKNFDKTIYQLSEGIGRLRGRKEGGIQATKTWGNTIITSGEMPMTMFSSGAGAINRIIELNCDDKLFANGNSTATDLRNNYGFAGRRFVEYLCTESNLEKARELFNRYIDEFLHTDITDKQTMAASLILTADNIISDITFGGETPLTVAQMSEYLKTKTDMDINRRAYEYVREYCTMNITRFMDDDNKGEIWGTYDEDYFYIIRTQFKKICENGGFNDAALLNWLKQNNLIEYKKGNLKTKKICGEAISCVWLKKQTEYENIEDDEEYPF